MIKKKKMNLREGVTSGGKEKTTGTATTRGGPEKGGAFRANFSLGRSGGMKKYLRMKRKKGHFEHEIFAGQKRIVTEIWAWASRGGR